MDDHCSIKEDHESCPVKGNEESKEKRLNTWMWVWPQWEESSKMISSCFLRRWERNNTSALSKIKKQLGRANVLLRDLKAGTAEQEIIFFLMKNSLQLKLMLKFRMTKCKQTFQQSLRSPWGQSTSDKSHFHSWCELQSPNLGSHVWFGTEVSDLHRPLR